MKFKVVLKANIHSGVNGKYYLDQDGKLWADCDSNGVDMSGKRRIISAPEKLLPIFIKESNEYYEIPGELCS